MHRKFRSIKGFTLTEAVVTAAIVGLIGLVITRTFKQSSEVADRTIHAQDALTSNVWEMYLMIQDLRSASRHSVGSYVMNGGFEEAFDSTSACEWDKVTQPAPTVGLGYNSYISNSVGDDVKSGFASMSLVSLAQIVGSAQLSLDTSTYFTLSPGMAYMLSGWVKCDTSGQIEAKIQLIKSGFIQISTATVSNTWQHLSKRYPAAGVLGSAEKVKARIAIQSIDASRTAYFDDIALTPIYAVMASSFTAPTIERVVSNTTCKFDPVGFRFARWKNGSLILFRYRIDEKQGEYYLVRERFDKTKNMWVNTFSNYWAYGLESLVLSYNENNNLPANGKETPITIESLLRDRNAQANNLLTKPNKIKIFPLSP